MAGKPQYTEEDITEFIETAQLMGIAPAIKRLKYPSFPTAQKWFRERDLEMPSMDSLMKKAVDLRVFYGDNEKKYAVQALMDAIVEKIQEKDLEADELNKLSNALAKAVQTFNLIEGKATGINENRSKDAVDLGAMDLIQAAKAKNALKQSELG